MSISASIKEFALDLGYCDVGIAPAERYTEFIDDVTNRKELYHFFVARPTKPVFHADPANVTAQAKSVISVAYNYMTHAFPKHLLQYIGRAYLGRCYMSPPDRIQGSRFKLLCEHVTSLGCTIQKDIFVPERWAAARAGVATFGRNNFAYASKGGSFVILSSIVVDKELDYDTHTTEIPCPSDCTICMKACPSKAIYAPNKLNPQRCLAFNAWMTREGMPGQTGYIEPEMRELMGTRVHGCDYCQEACPRNQTVLKATCPEDPFLELLARDFSLEKMLVMDDTFYHSRVQPIMYNYLKEKKYFQRNAAIAIGNLRNSEHVPLLENALRNNSQEMVRGYAAWALGRIGGTRSKTILEAAVGTESSPFASSEINAALNR